MELALGLILLGLAFSALFALARRFHARLERAGSARRVAAACLIGIAALIPAAGGLAALSDRLREQRLARRVEIIAPALDAVARGGIGPFAHSDVPGSIFRLLRGELVRRSPTVRYVPLDLEKRGGERRSAEGDLPFRIHERAVRSDDVLRYPVEQATIIDQVAVAVSADASGAISPLEITIVGPASARRRLSMGMTTPRLHGWGSDESRVEVQVLGLSPAVVGATAVEVRGLDKPTKVSGICLVGNQQSIALVPEERTQTGLPVLAGTVSASSGIELRPGDRPTEFSFEPAIACDRLWLVYAATDPRAAEYRWFREDILELRLEFDDGALPGRLLLCHGVDIHSANLDRSRHAEDFESSIATTWESDGVRWHADERGWVLGGTRHLRRIILRNRSGDSGYSVNLLGITLATSVGDQNPSQFAGVIRQVGESVQTDLPTRQELAGVRLAFADRRGVIRAVEGVDAERLVGASMEDSDLREVLLNRPRSPRCSSIAGIEADVAFVPVRDEEAVIGVLIAFVPEPDRATRHERFALLPLGALILLLPLLVVTFSESLAGGERIRRKIALALAIASVVPIGVLLLAVPRAFDRARDDAVVRRLTAELDAVRERLVRVRESAAAEAAAFSQMLQEHPRISPLFLDPSRPDLVQSLRRELKQARERQFGETPAFVRIEIRFPGTGDSLWKTVDDYDASLAPEGLDLQASDFYRVRSHLAIVGVDRRVDGDRRFRCVVGKLVDPPVEKGRETRFYGLDGGEIGSRPPSEGSDSRDVAAAIASALRANRPVPIPGGLTGVVDAFRDREGSPLFAIGVFEPAAHGDVTLLGFHTSLIGLLGAVAIVGVISAIALARILTERLTGSIEKLAEATQETRHGRLASTVDTRATDEIGLLAEQFQAMSSEVGRRIDHLSKLQRGMLVFGGRLDRHAVALEASRFIASSARAEEAILVLPEAHGRGLRAYSSTGKARQLRPSTLLRHLLSADASTYIADRGPLAFSFLESFDRHWVGRARALIGGPIRMGSREEGAFIALFEMQPDSGQASALHAASSSIAIALENARIHGLAVQDAETGALVPHYFRQRLEELVERAFTLHGTLWVIRIEFLGSGLNAPKVGGALVSLARRLHRVAGVAGDVVFGRTGPAEITVAASNLEPLRRERYERALRRAGARLAFGVGAESRVRTAEYPKDALSADLLLASLRGDQAPDSASPEGDLAAFVGGDVPAAPGMRKVLLQASRTVSLELPVLLVGEDGVGKEWLAHRMHLKGSGSGAPFVRIRLATIPSTLAESELFGVERGAFSDATESRPGLFEQANGGTVFLDQVGEASLELQAKLLRVLQTPKIRRVGGTREISLRYRVIASTTRDLVEFVRDGRFRADLYFRLCGVQLTIPPIRERLVDLPGMAKQVLAEELGADSEVRLTSKAIDRLLLHSWPGNSSELRSVLRRAAVAVAPGSSIDDGDLEIGEHVVPVEVDHERRHSREPFWHELGDRWNERQRRLLLAFSKGRRITMREYVELNRVSARTGLRDLHELARSGRIRKEGHKRGTSYRIM